MKILSSLVAVLSAFLFQPVSAEDEAKADRLTELLGRCSDYYFGKFKITPYLEFAQAFQTLPREVQAKKLMVWAEDPLNERKLHILCQMLFCEKDGSSVIKPSGLGAAAGFERFPAKPHFYGPSAIYENCHILICDGHRIAGMQVPSSHYLRISIEKNLWREISYAPQSDEKQRAIIAAFLKSEIWSDLTVVYDDPTFFTHQIGNPPADQAPPVSK